VQPEALPDLRTMVQPEGSLRGGGGVYVSDRERLLRLMAMPLQQANEYSAAHMQQRAQSQLGIYSEHADTHAHALVPTNAAMTQVGAQ
jgi:hypothetical protein